MLGKENSLHKSHWDNILVEIDNAYNYSCRRYEILNLFRSYGTNLLFYFNFYQYYVPTEQMINHNIHSY
jgi:hypothetical protein